MTKINENVEKVSVLVVGSGGREHAICYSFSKNEFVGKLYCANGNAGIASVAECVPIDPIDVSALVEFAIANSIDLTFVGGESSLAVGIVDAFEERGLRIIGPNKLATQLESSKIFAKDFMARHGVPTAKYVATESSSAAIEALESGAFGYASLGVVVKADGLAAGKGVVVAANRAEAIAAINDLASLAGETAAERIVLEECMFGREVSLLMFADGEDYVLMPPTRDHKRIGDGDTGPNTGGMGTFTDASLLDPLVLAQIEKTMIRPTLKGCIAEGFRFRGILFLGLMMTDDGPKLLEYNVRFGDPETQSILMRLDTSILDICNAMLDASLDDVEVKWRPGSSACVVLASLGYPASPKTGDMITGIDEAESSADIKVFHAGTAMLTPDEFFTAGGRVLGVTAVGDDLDASLSKAYAAAAKINFAGMQFRRDIGK